MRLNLYWRGRDVIDIEAHVWRRRPDDEPQDDGPTIRAAGFLQDSSRAEPMEAPDCTVSTFGFGRQPESVAKGPGQKFVANCPRPRPQASPPSAPPRGVTR